MKTHFGVIGLGNRGEKLALHSIKNHPDLELVAVCDMSAKKFPLFKEEKIKKYNDYQALLADENVDAVVIATPDDTHGEIIAAAVKADKHIICEKPIEITPEKTKEVEKVLLGYHKVFLVGYVLRYAPLFYKAKQLLEAGVIGDIILGNAIDHIHYGGYAFFHDWHREKKNSGSLLLQKATHSLDIINWLVNAKPTQVAGIGGLEVYGEKGGQRRFGKKMPEDLRCGTCDDKWECEESIINRKKHKGISWQDDWADNCVFSEKVDVDDHQSLLIKYENNTTMTYSLCQFAAFYRREFQFFGTKGELYFDDERNEIVINDRKTTERTVHKVDILAGHGGGDEEMLLDFIHCVHTNAQPRADLQSSVVATNLAFFAEQAIRENRFVNIQ